VEPEQVDPITIRMHATFTGHIRDTPLEETVTVPVYIARGTCDRCGRIAGDYWNALVQVRATNRTPTDAEMDRAAVLAREYIADREATGDRNAFITSAVREASGLNMKISANQMGEAIAHRIVRELGGSVSAAETLTTEDGDGNELYRVTFVARLPEFTPGDVVDFDDVGTVEYSELRAENGRVSLAYIDRSLGHAIEERLDGLCEPLHSPCRRPSSVSPPRACWTPSGPPTGRPRKSASRNPRSASSGATPTPATGA